MHEFFVTKDPHSNRDHEVHRFGCRFLPEPGLRISIGNFKHYQEALIEARKVDPISQECPSCTDYDIRSKPTKTKRIS
jgi:hypothetical protein